MSVSLAVPSDHIKREYDDPTAPSEVKFRNEFMRDRDRIMYSKAFRKLASKTQVFLSGTDEHLNSRLTHTLEVSQIAATLSRQLGFDEDLAQAIAMGHDLGHTPFGHAGERTLNLIMNGCDNLVRSYLYSGNDEVIFPLEHRGFKHNLQGLRIVSDLELSEKDFKGLNLTCQTRFGIQNHSRSNWGTCDYGIESACYFHPKNLNCCSKDTLSVDFYNIYTRPLQREPSWSFEAATVICADEIAQRHNDLEDAVNKKLLEHSQALKIINSCFKETIKKNSYFVEKFTNLARLVNTPYFVPRLSAFVMNFLMKNLVFKWEKNIAVFKKKYGIVSDQSFRACYPSIDFEDTKRTLALDNIKGYVAFRDALKDIILNFYDVHRMDGKAKYIIRRLFKAYITNYQQLPDDTVREFFNYRDGVRDYETRLYVLRNKLEEIKKETDPQIKLHNKMAMLRAITDFIAGMTDIAAINEYRKLYMAEPYDFS